MARAISGLLQSNNQTRLLVSKAWSLAKLQELINTSLPVEILALGSIQAGNLYKGELTLLVTNPALATRLRFASQTILEAIKFEGRLKIHSIKVRIAAPSPQRRKTNPSVKREMSNADQVVLLRAAKTAADPELAAAFRRLAANHIS